MAKINLNDENISKNKNKWFMAMNTGKLQIQSILGKAKSLEIFFYVHST